MQISIINRAAEDRFMYGVKQSIRAHCIILLSQVILSQVGSLFFLCFILYEETGDRSTPRMSLKIGQNFRQTGLVTEISVILFTIQYTENYNKLRLRCLRFHGLYLSGCSRDQPRPELEKIVEGEIWTTRDLGPTLSR